jgi:hypothetical protein
VNGPPKSGPILAGTWLSFADLFCHFESVTDFTRGILGLITDLVFGMPKTLAVPSYKYARVLKEKIYTEDAQHASPQPACCTTTYAISSRSSACTGDRESRSSEPRPQRSCTERERIRFLGSTLRDCSNASTSSSSTSSSPWLVWGATRRRQARGGVNRHRRLLYPIILVRQETYGFLSLV